MTDAVIRTFIAIELSDEITRELGRTISSLRELVTGNDVKWVPPTGIHLTLKFMGDVPASQIPEIQDSLRPVCAAANPIQLSLAGLGAFPSPRAPRVVWVGLQGELESLRVLAAAVDQALATLGFAAESRSFTPHLTLARIRQEGQSAVTSALGNSILRGPTPQRLLFAADAVSIMRSQLAPRGAVYNRLAHLPLGRTPTR